jgi:sugar lactone lactonase YvrE
MKKNQKQILIIIIAIVAILVLLKIVIFSGVRLNKPESVAFDPVGNRFLISNVGSGSIVAMDENGKFHKYMPKAFEAPKGLFLKDDMLYVTDPTKIHVVDVSEAKIMDTYEIEGAVGLNDIAIDENGLLYITDMGGDCVYIYDPAAKTQYKVLNPLLKAPNGIVYDRPRWQMFIVNNAERSPILSLDIRDRKLSIFMDSVYSNLDGIAIDDPGRIFISSWNEEMIVQIPQEQNRFIAFQEGIKGAADMYYHLPTNELIVPLLTSNKIQRFKLD